MPKFGKSTIALYFRAGCRLQTKLDSLSEKGERAAHGAPPQLIRNDGIKLEGRKWELKKLLELRHALDTDLGTGGRSRFRGDLETNKDGEEAFATRKLSADLEDNALPGDVIVQAEFPTEGGSFARLTGLDLLVSRYGLTCSSVIPDILMVVAADDPSLDGSLPMEVTLMGKLLPIIPGDGRLGLRVVDIKMTSEANAGYFAEIAYYSVALACWIHDMGLGSRYAVLSDCAIWPGAHEASAMTKLARRERASGGKASADQLMSAFQEELEIGPFEPFIERILRFTRTEYPEILATDWQEQPWHVDSRCQGCPYLGHDWVGVTGHSPSNASHCMPRAKIEGSLSRMAFLPRGAAAALKRGGVTSVSHLATTHPSHRVFDTHQALRTSREMLVARAASLTGGLSGSIEGGGTSSAMPRYASLKIYVTAAWDPGSRLTFAFGLSASWRESTAFGAEAPVGNGLIKRWDSQAYVVDQRDPEMEQREFMSFLRAISEILRNDVIRNSDVANETVSTYQIYIWDKQTYEHLRKVAGRHLEAVLADEDTRGLSWLFPAADLLPKSAANSAESPVTVVQDVVRASVAIPVPHFYSLLNVARAYHPEGTKEGLSDFRVNYAYEDPLTDQIPAERAHEIWTRSGSPNWAKRLVQLDQTVFRQLSALDAVTRRLGTDLRDRLVASAPPIPREIVKKDRDNKTSPDGIIWGAYAALNNAHTRSEIMAVRAMPPYEREARFKTAILTRRLTGNECDEALSRLGLEMVDGRRAYTLSPRSLEVSAREGDSTWAVSPASRPGFLGVRFSRILEGTDVVINEEFERKWLMEDALAVTVVAVDRTRAVIVLDFNPRRPGIADELEQAGIADLSSDVALDKIHLDVFRQKLAKVLGEIGTPAMAAAGNSRIAGVRGRNNGKRIPDPVKPVAELLWTPLAMQQSSVSRDVPKLLALLEAGGMSLNHSQREALHRCLVQRLHLVWGPPGTGKSHTLVATLVAAMLSRRSGRIRILVTAFTWTAVDNVLKDLIAAAAIFFRTDEVAFARVRSGGEKGGVPRELEPYDMPLSRWKPSPAIVSLRQILKGSISGRPNIVVVGSTAHQVHNLILAGNPKSAIEDLFDLVVIDEGSQMDVAHATVALASLARGGSVIVAGDPLQLSPIHPAEAPEKMADTVGSIYGFLRSNHGVAQTPLSVNYRSNAAIVGFCRNAGYDPALRANSPDLRIRLAPPIPVDRPDRWPASLPWSGQWKDLLDPSRPLTCFVYPDGISSQWNEFEAQAVASMVRILSDHMLAGCSGALGHDGVTPKPPMTGRYTPREFWSRGVGIVTPHRAQQGLVASRLEAAFTNDPGHDRVAMLGAVDTVERFQGQERDVIIATLALGDPDMIAGEAEFLYSLNRFNVLASRAKAKLIVLISSEIVDHLPSDLKVLRDSRLLKSFVNTACPSRQNITLPWSDADGNPIGMPGSLRWLDAVDVKFETIRDMPDNPNIPPDIEKRSSPAPVKPLSGAGSFAAMDDDIFDKWA